MACPSGDKGAWGHSFAPAKPEPPSAFVPWEETKATAAQEAAMQGPEAPECSHAGGRTTASGDGPRGPWHDFKCDECGASWRRRWNSEVKDWGGEPEALGSPPRRPPYAVAYTLANGDQYEVALPGDATVRAHEGALIITHASAVQALIQTRPMEGA